MRYLIALLRTLFSIRRYKKQTRKAMRIFAEFNSSDYVPDPNAYKKPLPVFADRLRNGLSQIRERSGDTNIVIGYGDSIMDGGIRDLKSVDINCGAGGAWYSHIKDMVTETHSAIALHIGIENVSTVVVGTLAGNPLIMRQPVFETTDRSIEVLDYIRSVFPGVRLVVFGIPPTVSAYVNETSLCFEQWVYQWVLRDINSAFLPLNRTLGKWWVLPKNYNTSDGIHLTPLGYYRMDKELNRAINGSGKLYDRL